MGFVVVLAVVLVGYFLIKPPRSEDEGIPGAKVTGEIEPIKITQVDIKETNFSGSKPAIAGSAEVARVTREYVDQQVKDFKGDADRDVPDVREKFGADHPAANYTIDIEAKYMPGTKTNSIILNMYMYTGGANGNSLYTVFTESKKTGEMLSLSDIILTAKKEEFRMLVVNNLLSWRPEDSEGLVLFEDVVGGLTFDSFKDWSLDSENLTLYFDKYEIGPGVLGAMAFPISRSKIESYLAL